jgi:hypothetical protein
LRKHCAAIVERGAPATAIHVRDIVKQIYAFAVFVLCGRPHNTNYVAF